MAGNRVSTQTIKTPVEVYLGELARLLRGPRRRREQILAELRDSIGHAVDERIAGGLTETQAAKETIAEFGTPQVVADAFAGELATAYARRTIAVYIASGPLVGIWWLLLLQPHPLRAGLVALLLAIPVLPLIAIAIAAAATTLATTGRLIRWLPEASPRRALTAAVAIAVLVLAADNTVIAIYARSDIPIQPLAVAAIVASLIRIGCSILTVGNAIAIRRTMTEHTADAQR